ncbi:hypothetical protein E3T61_05020 [Cryobacterium lactosi]|uniref:Uncharacterized protein n=1 Tax=Cryobacterium lactosi TaxID=1259202 RepID=A0A4R9BX97_9MICO|nr:hypothetical protein [Cryobacterium lactosi]TFD93452.1 hypothetical protein E3T61_05020 [Cryobacterium lactosi]
MSSSAIPTTTGRALRYVQISAWAIPVLVIGQFSMLAIIPVALVLVGTLRDTRLRALRWWGGLLAASYVAPLAIWLLRPDGAQSLSKDMHPAFAALIVAVAAVVLVKLYRPRR